MTIMKKFRAALAAAATAALLASVPVSAAETGPSYADPGTTDADAVRPPAFSRPPAASPAPAQSQAEALLAAASAGNVEAMNNLAIALTLGARGPADYELALYWYQKAIDGGCASAMNNLGALYLHGIGVPQDYANAFHWFAHSAEHGDVLGTYRAAEMAETGLGTSRDLRLAKAMYRKAARSGFGPAMIKVSDDLSKTTAASSDLVDAYAWLRVALDAGLPEEMQIAVMAKMDTLGGRLGAQRRDDARVRAGQLAAELRSRAAAPVQSRVPWTDRYHRYADARSQFM